MEAARGGGVLAQRTRFFWAAAALLLFFAGLSFSLVQRPGVYGLSSADAAELRWPALVSGAAVPVSIGAAWWSKKKGTRLITKEAIIDSMMLFAIMAALTFWRIPEIVTVVRITFQSFI